mmetsp:Transcript_8102/g.25588  ORF Transcript_8102/g.25588 Transcript_8102/m.25588 type:complete len:208 (+) Transcript_8102:2414-3037(+)
MPKFCITLAQLPTFIGPCGFTSAKEMFVNAGEFLFWVSAQRGSVFLLSLFVFSVVAAANGFAPKVFFFCRRRRCSCRYHWSGGVSCSSTICRGGSEPLLFSFLGRRFLEMPHELIRSIKLSLPFPPAVLVLFPALNITTVTTTATITISSRLLPFSTVHVHGLRTLLDSNRQRSFLSFFFFDVVFVFVPGRGRRAAEYILQRTHGRS